MSPLLTALAIMAGAFALGLALPALALGVFPRRLARDTVFAYGVARRAARVSSGPLLYAAFTAPLLISGHGKVLWLVAGGGLMLALGVLDDIRTLPKWLKVLTLALAAFLAARNGIIIDTLKPPFTTSMLSLGFWAIPATVVWIGVVTTGLIQTRRLPGATCGLVGIAAITFLLVALRVGGSMAGPASATAAAIAGASLGYLRYDFFPPRLPLGSSGYYSISFALAALSVLGALKNTAFLILLLPVLALAVPVLDNTYAVLYGSLAGKHALAFGRRRELLHEALLRTGLGLRRCLVLLYLVAAYCCLIALALVFIIEVTFVAKIAVLAILGLLGLALFYIMARVAAVPAPQGAGRIDLLDVPVDRLDMAQALDRVEQFVAERSPHMIVTSDTSSIVRARNDPELQEIMRRADLVTPDGIGVVWMARVLGQPLRERVSGVDLMDGICERASRKGYDVYLLGAAPGVAEQAAANLCRRYPGLRIAGCHHGYFSPGEEPGVVAQIAGSRPDILFVAMGIPKQEKWIRGHLAELGVAVAIGVGGSFDVMAGVVRRAPQWVRALGLEWLYRTVRDPRRIPRLLAIPRFIWMAAVSALLRRRSTKGN